MIDTKLDKISSNVIFITRQNIFHYLIYDASSVARILSTLRIQIVLIFDLQYIGV